MVQRYETESSESNSIVLPTIMQITGDLNLNATGFERAQYITKLFSNEGTYGQPERSPNFRVIKFK